MIALENGSGTLIPCKYLVEAYMPQPETKECFWQILAIGYDGVRRTPLMTFNTREECHKRYEKIREEYDRQVDAELDFLNIKK